MVVSKAFKRIFALISIFCLMFFSVNSGYKLGKSEGIDNEQESKKVSMQANKDVIVKDTKITTTYIYKKCGHKNITCDAPTQDMLGLSVMDFMERFPDYTIKDFTSENVSLIKIIDNYCDKHYLLKLVDNRAMVLRYNLEDDDFIIIQRTKLITNDLDVDQIKLLNRGKLFNSIDDVNKYIDSIKKY